MKNGQPARSEITTGDAPVPSPLIKKQVLWPSIPNGSYSGDVVPVKVQAAGYKWYNSRKQLTHLITPVVPTSKMQQRQISKVPLKQVTNLTEGDPNVPIDEDTPATFLKMDQSMKTVDKEGTYTVSPDGTCTFVPEKLFTELLQV